MGGRRMTDPRGVHESVAAIAARLGGTVGVAARNLASGAEVHIAADDLFPMASCFKIPVMVEVMRRVDAGTLRLDDRLTLTEADKSPGSTLIHCHEGLRPSVRDLLYLMITLSDNTATDMLWRLVGLASVNETMRAAGPGDASTASCRTASTSSSRRAPARSGPASAAPRSSPAGARSRRAASYEDAFRRVLEENARLSGAGFQHLYERRWGRDESLGYEDSFAVDQALDNMGTPRDMAELLAMIAQHRCASAPSCRLMIEVMSQQEWREKIPAGLPDGLLVANKTGGVSGTSNDAAIVYTPVRGTTGHGRLLEGPRVRGQAAGRRGHRGDRGVLYAHLGEPA